MVDTSGFVRAYFETMVPFFIFAALTVVARARAVIIMPVLWIQKRRISRETNCAPLSTDALQSATCFLMSLALLGGLLTNYLFGISRMDYVVTGVILAFVAKESMEAFQGRASLPSMEI